MTNLTGAAEMRVTASTRAAEDAARPVSTSTTPSVPDQTTMLPPAPAITLQARANVLHSQFGHGLGRFAAAGGRRLCMPQQGRA